MRTTHVARTKTSLLLLGLTQLLFATASAQSQAAPANPVEAQARKAHYSCSWLRFRVTQVTAPEGQFIRWLSDLNNRGQVVGESYRDLQSHAFVWSKGQAVDLHDRIYPSAVHTSATSLNDRAQVIGQYYVDPRPAGPANAYLLDKRSVTYLDDAHFAYASDINNRGQIVGWSQLPGQSELPVLWEGGQVIQLPSLPPADRGYAFKINNRGEILGRVSQQDWSGTSVTVIWKPPYTAATPVPLPAVDSGIPLFAQDMNEGGDILLNTDADSGWLLQRGTLTKLVPLPGEYETEAFDMNDWGLAVGTSETPGSEFRTAVVWLNGGKPCRLFDLIPPQHRPAGMPALGFAGNVNNLGQILAGDYLLTPTLSP